MEEIYSWLTVTLAQLVVMLAGGVQLASNMVPSLFFPTNALSKIEIILSFVRAELLPTIALQLSPPFQR